MMANLEPNKLIEVKRTRIEIIENYLYLGHKLKVHKGHLTAEHKETSI